MSLYIVDKDLIREFFVEDSDNVKPLAVVGQKGRCSQVVDFIIQVRLIRVCPTEYLLGELGRFAFSDVGGVGGILGIDEEILIAHIFELFFSQEGVFEH